jgi:hypothetical protein
MTRPRHRLTRRARPHSHAIVYAPKDHKVRNCALLSGMNLGYFGVLVACGVTATGLATGIGSAVVGDFPALTHPPALFTPPMPVPVPTIVTPAAARQLSTFQLPTVADVADNKPLPSVAPSAPEPDESAPRKASSDTSSKALDTPGGYAGKHRAPDQQWGAHEPPSAPPASGHPGGWGDSPHGPSSGDHDSHDGSHESHDGGSHESHGHEGGGHGSGHSSHSH